MTAALGVTAPTGMSATERGELADWLAWMFEALVNGSAWPDDLTPRSQNNEFHWDVARARPEAQLHGRKTQPPAKPY
jgi:hypothetical protein